jgi:hypothetical protein
LNSEIDFIFGNYLQSLVENFGAYHGSGGLRLSGLVKFPMKRWWTKTLGHSFFRQRPTVVVFFLADLRDRVCALIFAYAVCFGLPREFNGD